jgi:hypothetical protein
MEWFLIWLICGFVGAAIAESRGHGCAGLIMGFLFGPLGILIALAMPPNYKGMGKKQCPYCREWIDPLAIKCPKCQSDLRPKCPQCGSPLEGVDKYCPFCGYELPLKNR